MQHSQRINQQQDVHPALERNELINAFQNQKVDIGILLVRCTVGGLMLFHGISKLFQGTAGVAQALESVGLPVFLSFGVLIAEVAAPIMLIMGFKVRIAAMLIAFDMFMAILIVHSKEFFKLSESGGWMLELNAFYFFGAIAILFMGAGRLSVTKGRGYLD
jgi:putative oxidoreductase